MFYLIVYLVINLLLYLLCEKDMKEYVINKDDGVVPPALIINITALVMILFGLPLFLYHRLKAIGKNDDK